MYESGNIIPVDVSTCGQKNTAGRSLWMYSTTCSIGIGWYCGCNVSISLFVLLTTLLELVGEVVVVVVVDDDDDGMGSADNTV
jgi:hypothetical protein